MDNAGIEQVGNGVISVRSYLGTLLLGTFPILGDILLLKWSKDKNVRVSKQNVCKAYLILKLSIYYPVAIIFMLIITGVCNG